jgi:hypothetical protein
VVRTRKLVMQAWRPGWSSHSLLQGKPLSASSWEVRGPDSHECHCCVDNGWERIKTRERDREGSGWLKKKKDLTKKPREEDR